jgi:hypothetical protein
MIGTPRFACYEKSMARARRTFAQPRETGDWGRLIVSAGLASAIMSGAGLVNELLATERERCLLSQQIVGDETPNMALSSIDRRTLAAQADRRLRRCLGDKR